MYPSQGSLVPLKDWLANPKTCEPPKAVKQAGEAGASKGCEADSKTGDILGDIDL